MLRIFDAVNILSCGVPLQGYGPVLQNYSVAVLCSKWSMMRQYSVSNVGESHTPCSLASGLPKMEVFLSVSHLLSCDVAITRCPKKSSFYHQGLFSVCELSAFLINRSHTALKPTQQLYLNQGRTMKCSHSRPYFIIEGFLFCTALWITAEKNFTGSSSLPWILNSHHVGSVRASCLSVLLGDWEERTVCTPALASPSPFRNKTGPSDRKRVTETQIHCRARQQKV